MDTRVFRTGDLALSEGTHNLVGRNADMVTSELE